MTPENIVRLNLDAKHVMQLATVEDGQPWVCSVYFVSDKEHNLYWASWPSRKHSQDIQKNNQVAATVVISSDKDKPVAGIQIKGVASLLDDAEKIREIAEEYAKKFNRSKYWVEDISNNRTEHRIYKLKPTKYVLFDEIHFPRNSRFELNSL